MSKIVLIDASPRHEQTTCSSALAGRAAAAFPGGLFETQTVRVRQSLQNGPEPDFASMRQADALIVIFPLYFFSLPGLLMRFLQDYAAFCRTHGGQKPGTRVYAVVNCGFPEPGINAEAVGVVRCFSRRIGAQFGFGIMLGGGPMFSAAQDAPPVQKAAAALDAGFARMAGDLTGGAAAETGDIQVSLPFPRRLYLFVAGQNWKQQARKNGLRPAQLYRRPYSAS